MAANTLGKSVIMRVGGTWYRREGKGAGGKGKGGNTDEVLSFYCSSSGRSSHSDYIEDEEERPPRPPPRPMTEEEKRLHRRWGHRTAESILLAFRRLGISGD